MARRSTQQLVALFESRRVVAFSEIRAALGGASRTTAFRYLERVPYRSSYNKNGRFYTLHRSDQYDRWGLFSVGDVYFSIDGTLKATVVRLVCESDAGRTQHELQELLRVRLHLFLAGALREGTISRERLGRVYLYLHVDPEVRTAQLRRREEMGAEASCEAIEVDTELTIRVLLVLIRYPGSQPGDVVRRLRGRLPPVTRAEVDSVFARYDLGKKTGPSIF
jgi:hypothetical protein